MHDHVDGELALQRNRPCNAQLQLHIIRKILIAFKTNGLIAEISRATGAVIGAFPAPVRILDFNACLVP